MKCVEAGNLLEALHDGALNPEAAKHVEEHLSACHACKAELVRLRMVSGLLRKSQIPAPSAELDAVLMNAFRQKHGQAKRSTWRFLGLGIFSGSVSVPKPALAMAALIVVMALAAAVKVGMIASKPLVVDVTAAPPVSPTGQATGPATVEQIRYVEVPVVREKVRTVYVGAKRGAARSSQGTRDSSPGGGDLAMSGSVSKNGYFTRANLSGFVPLSEMKTRVISEVKEDEK